MKRSAKLHLLKTTVILAVMQQFYSGCALFNPGYDPKLRSSGQIRSTIELCARNTLQKLFPCNTLMHHRAIITIGNRQIPCDGYLSINCESGVHFTIVAPLGILTDMDIASNGNINLNYVAPKFPQSWATKYIARDIRTIFMSYGDKYHFSVLDDGKTALSHFQDKTGVVLRHLFCDKGEIWLGIDIRNQGKLLYEVVSEYPGQFDDIPHAVPVRLVIRAEKYNVDLRLIRMQINNDKTNP